MDRASTSLARGPRQENESDHCDANETDDIDIACVCDEAKPAKSMADIEAGAMRAAHSELASPLLTWPFPRQQRVRQLQQRWSHEVELRIELPVAVRTRFHGGVQRTKGTSSSRGVRGEAEYGNGVPRWEAQTLINSHQKAKSMSIVHTGINLARNVFAVPSSMKQANPRWCAWA